MDKGPPVCVSCASRPPLRSLSNAAFFPTPHTYYSQPEVEVGRERMGKNPHIDDEAGRGLEEEEEEEEIEVRSGTHHPLRPIAGDLGAFRCPGAKISAIVWWGSESLPIFRVPPHLSTRCRCFTAVE